MRVPSWVLPAAATSLVVGTLLSLANQGSQLWNGPFDVLLACRLAVNFAVPLLVAGYSRWSATRTTGP